MAPRGAELVALYCDCSEEVMAVNRETRRETEQCLSVLARDRISAQVRRRNCRIDVCTGSNHGITICGHLESALKAIESICMPAQFVQRPALAEPSVTH